MGSIGPDDGDASPHPPEQQSLGRPSTGLLLDTADSSLKGATATLQSNDAGEATQSQGQESSSSTNAVDAAERQQSGTDSPIALSVTHTPVLDEPVHSSAALLAETATSAPANDGASSVINGAQAYGTRSRRNRPGISRPNYAEDHDMEMDFESVSQSGANRSSGAGTSHNNHSSTPATATGQATLAPSSRQSPPATAATLKRVASSSSSSTINNAASTNGWSALNSSAPTSNSSIPGTSTFSANPQANVSKKRKAGGAVASGNGANVGGEGVVANNSSGAGAGAGAGAGKSGQQQQQQQQQLVQVQGTAGAQTTTTPSSNATSTRRANHIHAAQLASATTTTTTTNNHSTVTAGGKHSRHANIYSFTKTKAKLQNGSLVADDGTTFSVNDHIYLICEPPGDPYYLGRIMQFRSRDTEDPQAPIDSIRINWVYRPRDVQRLSVETRLVFATMHSDICPLSSLRGKCVVSHKNEFDSVDEYKKSPDHFYFTQVFDRFMHRWFEVIPTTQVVNVPENVKQALDSRWKYIVVEASKVKELTSDAKRCKRCGGYCASHDSVDCAVCHLTYHMCCVRPPILKKPSRGFAWACGPCSRAQERKLEARRTPVLGSATPDVEEEEMVEEEEEEVLAPTTGAATPEAFNDRPATDAEVAHAKMWTMRYLGIHCRVEDALQYDDRAIFPRAGSRLGPKHQANVLPWYGRPVELVKPADIKKKYVRIPGKKEATKLSKDTLAAMEADRAAKASRPPYIQDEPPGYVARGEDHPNKDKANTAILYFKMPEQNELPERGLDEPVHKPHDVVQHYMSRAEKVAKSLGVQPYSVDFLDRALYCLQECSYDADNAIKQLKKTDPVGKWPDNKNQIRKDLRDPHLSFSADEKKRFEEGVAIYGSELRGVRATVETQSHADIVRYWYHWKKSVKGHEIWGSYGGRKNTKKLKAENEVAAKLVDDIAHDQDDSAFDNGKIEKKSRKMICKHCSSKHSRIWRRAPGVSPGQTMPGEGRMNKKEAFVIALCDRCARLWRRYAIKWENMDEIMKKLAQVGSKSWKKKLDPELLREIELFNENKGQQPSPTETPEPMLDTPAGAEPAKKKARHSLADGAATDGSNKKKPTAPVQPALPPAPLPPLPVEQPTWKLFPCSICLDFESDNDQLVVCRDCRLTVHRKCYGVSSAVRVTGKWTCDMCANDRRDMAAGAGSSLDPASYTYCCVLCPIEQTPREMVEAPKISHSKKKKDEREKIKETAEKELALKMSENYKLQQRELGRPVIPREALKRTADNNWVHVTCAMFISEIKFSNAKTLDVAEGVPFALRNRNEYNCTLCNTNRGAALRCQSNGCHKAFHAMCAAQAGCKWGFDIMPVKNSRRDNEAIVTIGKETGRMNAVMWCKDHSPLVKTMVYPLNEKLDEAGTTAMQFYAQSCKQADENITGTTRKANQLDEYTKVAALSDPRRTSTTAPPKIRMGSQVHDLAAEPERRCVTCNIDSTPKWWKVAADDFATNGHRTTDSFGAINGIKKEAHQSRESSMRVEALLSNGTSPPRLRGPKEPSSMPSMTSGRTSNHSRTGSTAIRYECHRCHHRRLHPLPVQDKMEVEETIESPMVVSQDLPRPPPTPSHSWSSLSTIPAQPATHGTWPPPPSQYPGPGPAPSSHSTYPRPPYPPSEGSSYPPPAHSHPRDPPYITHENTYPRQEPHYSTPDVYGHSSGHGPPNGHSGPIPAHQSVHSPAHPSSHTPHHTPSHAPSHPPPQMPPHPPSPYHHSPHGTPGHVHSHIGSNGMAPHSPTHPLPSHLPRHSQSPYQSAQPHPASQPAMTSHGHTYPPPPSHHHQPYHHHHHSPVPHHRSPVARPSPGSDNAPNGSGLPLPPPRSLASGSASVRNLID